MPKTILIVDDDPNILDTAKDILEDAGYSVHTASTSAAALGLIPSAQPDLAIVDFNLPDGKGIDWAVQARALRPGLPVILMTGEARVELGAAQEAIRTILTKPVNPSELIDVIRKNS